MLSAGAEISSSSRDTPQDEEPSARWDPVCEQPYAPSSSSHAPSVGQLGRATTALLLIARCCPVAGPDSDFEAGKSRQRMWTSPEEGRSVLQLSRLHPNLPKNSANF